MNVLDENHALLQRVPTLIPRLLVLLSDPAPAVGEARPMDEAVDIADEPPRKVQANTSRCWTCNRKIGLLGVNFNFRNTINFSLDNFLFFGGGDGNRLSDRDFLNVSLSYQF